MSSVIYLNESHLSGSCSKTLLRIAQVKVEGGHYKEEMMLTDNTAYDISQKHMSTSHPLPQDNPAHIYDIVPAKQETIYEHIK